MPIKIKIFFSFLGLFALFSVLALVNSSKGLLSLPSSPKLLTGTALEAVESDADHDGLTNTEESLWNTDFQNSDTDGDGYLDGEEAASGHDPLKPGPDDLSDKSQNLTEKVQKLIVGGLYSDDLKPNNKNFNSSINNLSAVIIDDFYKSQSYQKPKLILTDASKENQEFYLESAAQIIKRVFANHSIDTKLTKNFNQYLALFQESKKNFENIYQALSKISVPENWQEVHYALLDLIHRSIVDYDSVGSYQSDPYKASLALNDIKSMDNDVKDLLKQISSNINQNHLSPDDGFYKILNFFYK